MWDNMMNGHGFSDEMFRDFSEDELERAYKEGFEAGCKHGYEKAMRSAKRARFSQRSNGDGMSERNGYGERTYTIMEGGRPYDGGYFGGRDEMGMGNSGQTGSMSNGGYGERQRRDSQGRYM